MPRSWRTKKIPSGPTETSTLKSYKKLLCARLAIEDDGVLQDRHQWTSDLEMVTLMLTTGSWKLPRRIRVKGGWSDSTPEYKQINRNYLKMKTACGLFKPNPSSPLPTKKSRRLETGRESPNQFLELNETKLLKETAHLRPRRQRSAPKMTLNSLEQHGTDDMGQSFTAIDFEVPCPDTINDDLSITNQQNLETVPESEETDLLKLYQVCKDQAVSKPKPTATTHLFTEEWNMFMRTYEYGQELPEPFFKSQNEGFMESWRLTSTITLFATLEMMQDFEMLYHFCSFIGGGIIGMIKVVTPDAWSPLKSDWKHTVMSKVTPHFQKPNPPTTGFNGHVTSTTYEPTADSMTIGEFADYCETINYPPSKNAKVNFIKFNEEFLNSKGGILYCKDLPISLFDDNLKASNFKSLDTMYRREGSFDENNQEDGTGLCTPWAYIGSYMSRFSFHIEDYSAGSVNLLLWGALKYWRCIPPSFAIKFIELMKIVQEKFYPEVNDDHFIFHKTLEMTDQTIMDNNIIYNWERQEEGTMMIIFPFVFHSGFNAGCNFAESVNFFSGKKSMGPLIAMHPMCTKPNEDEGLPGHCEYGNNTTKDPTPWLRHCLTEQDFRDWEFGKLRGCHPYEFQLGPTRIAGANIENKTPRYPCNPKDEALPIALKLRGFFTNDQELMELRDLNVTRELQSLANVSGYPDPTTSAPKPNLAYPSKLVKRQSQRKKKPSSYRVPRQREDKEIAKSSTRSSLKIVKAGDFVEFVDKKHLCHGSMGLVMKVDEDEVLVKMFLVVGNPNIQFGNIIKVNLSSIRDKDAKAVGYNNEFQGDLNTFLTNV